MSKAALYQGLGAGLLSFGQNLQHQQAETARARREASLLALKRQWQLQDQKRQRKWDIEDLERQREWAEEDRDYVDPVDQARIGLLETQTAAQRDELENPDRVTPVDQARIGLIDAQADYYNQRANAGPEGVSMPSKIQELEYHKQVLISQGMDPKKAYEEARKVVYPSRPDADNQMWRTASSEARKLINEAEYPEDVMDRFGIDPETPVPEAIDILARDFYDRMRNTPGQEPADSGGAPGRSDAPTQQGNPPVEQVIPEAMQAIQAGASKIAIEQRLRDRGYTEDEIRRVMESL